MLSFAAIVKILTSASTEYQPQDATTKLQSHGREYMAHWYDIRDIFYRLEQFHYLCAYTDVVSMHSCIGL